MTRFSSMLLLSLTCLPLTASPAAAQWWGWQNQWVANTYWYSYPSYYVDPVPARLYAAGYYRRSVADSYKVFMEAEIVRQDALQKRIDTYLKTLEARRIGIREEPQLDVNWVENVIERNALLTALNPTDTEIKTGKAMRIMRQFLENHPQNLTKAASEEIPAEAMRNISFKVGRYEQGGSLFLLLGGKIAWFAVLQDKIFEKERQEFDELLQKVVNQAKVSGGVSQEMHERLIELVDKMDYVLEKNFYRVNNEVKSERWYTSDYFQAERFLKRDVMRALWDLKRLSPEEFAAVTQPPNVHNVFELLEYMRVKGVEFDKAQDKQVMAYYTIHRAFANEIKKIRTFRSNASPGQP